MCKLYKQKYHAKLGLVKPLLTGGGVCALVYTALYNKVLCRRMLWFLKVWLNNKYNRGGVWSIVKPRERQRLQGAALCSLRNVVIIKSNRCDQTLRPVHYPCHHHHPIYPPHQNHHIILSIRSTNTSLTIVFCSTSFYFQPSFGCLFSSGANPAWL